ncbi:hypothetical protein DICVIV_13978, partial [Dictyocaulus viviparus]
MYIPDNCRKSVYDIFLECREELRKLISDGEIRSITGTHSLSSRCEYLLETVPACDLSMSLREFRNREVLANNNRENLTKYEVFWDELFKYIILIFVMMEEIETREVLKLICHLRKLPTAVTFDVNFPISPPSSCFVMYSKQEQIIQNEITLEEIKNRWDAMLPKHRIPLFEQYKRELTNFIENLEHFLVECSQLNPQQKAHVEIIIMRTKSAIHEVNNIMGKLEMTEVPQVTNAEEYFRKNVWSHYSDIVDEKERERAIQEDFNKLP